MIFGNTGHFENDMDLALSCFQHCSSYGFAFVSFIYFDQAEQVRNSSSQHPRTFIPGHMEKLENNVFSVQADTIDAKTGTFPLIHHQGRRQREIVAGLVERVSVARSTRAVASGRSIETAAVSVPDIFAGLSSYLT